MCIWNTNRICKSNRQRPIQWQILMVFRLWCRVKKGYPLFSRLNSRKIPLESIFTTFLNGHTISSTGKGGKTCDPDLEIWNTPCGQRLPHNAIYQNNPDFIRTLTELNHMRTKSKRIRARKNTLIWKIPDGVTMIPAKKKANKNWRHIPTTKPKTTNAHTKTIMDETTK